jgi:4-hydroxy-tetrahydrodipicolinate reductase
MNILLVGYGKMGKTIEKIAISRGHAIAGRIDINSPDTIQPGADVAIEFSQPDAAVENISRCLAAGIPVVCGTTGWLDRVGEVESLTRDNNGGFFYASNYSLGVNIFFKINEFLAKLMNTQNGYEISVDETHHTEKKDAPSGTAITIAKGIMKEIESKKEWVNEPSSDPSKLVIRSFRKDPAPGTHVVRYRSDVDDIEISHTAHSREGFALGAVLVAEWLKGRKGVFTMEDFLKF